MEELSTAWPRLDQPVISSTSNHTLSRSNDDTYVDFQFSSCFNDHVQNSLSVVSPFSVFQPGLEGIFEGDAEGRRGGEGGGRGGAHRSGGGENVWKMCGDGGGNGLGAGINTCYMSDASETVRDSMRLPDILR
jgi:hypothetical protein